MSDVPTRLLRETLRARMTPASSSGCIDTETLAAWSDGTLRARDRAAAESHASSCPRCQALLAAMARTAPPAPARGWWHASTIGWLVPVAVAAAAVLLWINVPAKRTPPSVAAQQPASPVVTAPPVASADRRDESKDRERVPQQPAKVEEARPRAATGATRASARAEQANAASGGMRDAAVAPSSPTAPPAAAGPPPQVAATEPTPAQTSTDASTVATSRPLPPTRALTEQMRIGARAELMAKALAVPTVIVSPDANVRWRIAMGGDVERTVDGGGTWEIQSTGASTPPTAGAAPSPTICWLVGPRGLVVLSTDGRTWQRVPFPEAIDLGSIRASDAANATVTAIDGRTFTTVDGGKTWRAL